MPGISTSKTSIPFSRGGSQNWESYWANQPEVLFFGLYSEISGGQMPNKVPGSSDYLTVAGVAGSETYQCPNTAPYIAADTDYIWFKTDASQRTVTTAELIGYDLQRTPVKYDDTTPNAIVAIIILNAAVTGMKRDNLFQDMWLPILWDNSLNAYGHVKDNRGGTQQLWTPEAVALIYDNFTDTDDVLATNHTTDSGHGWAIDTYNGKIASNKLIANSSGAVTRIYTYTAGVTGNVDLSLDITIPSSDNYQAGILLRRNGTGQYWRIMIFRSGGGTPIVYIGRVAVNVSQANISHEVGVGTLRVVASDVNITVYWKGNIVINGYVSDGSWKTSPYHGMLLYYDGTYSNVAVDNFKLNVL